MERIENYTYSVNLQDLVYSSELLREAKLASFENTVESTKYVLIDFNAEESIQFNFKLTEAYDIHRYHNLDTLNHRVESFSKLEERSIESFLANRPWTIILADNTLKLAQSTATTAYSVEPLTEETFEEALARIEEQKNNEEINWHEAMNQTIDAWLEKKATTWIDDFNTAFQEGVASVNEFTNAISKYTKSNIGSRTAGAANALGGAINNATAQITQAFNSSNSELATMAKGNGAGVLKGSVLDFSYLSNVKAGLIKEPISFSKMSFINKVVEANTFTGPTFFPSAVSTKSYYQNRKVNHGELEFYPKGFSVITEKGYKKISEIDSEPYLTVIQNKSRLVHGEVQDLDTNENYDSTTKTIGDSKEYYQAIARNETYNKDHIEHQPNSQSERVWKKYQEAYSKIPNILNALDAQTQKYLAYFSTVYDGLDTPLELKTPGSGKDYFYFFYTNGFSFTPIKKSTITFEYGAFKSSKALENPEGSNSFSFTVPEDIELSFWDFVKKEGLGVSNSDIYSNVGSPQKINLNFLLLESNTAETPSIANAKVNKFVLENVKFSDLSGIDFNHSFGQLKDSDVKGVYKRLKWYHHLPVESLLTTK